MEVAGHAFVEVVVEDPVFVAATKTKIKTQRQH